MEEKEDKSIFNRALHNFTFDVAARGGIRHLYNLGLSAKEIQKELRYPLPLERIEKELSEYKKELSESDITDA